MSWLGTYTKDKINNTEMMVTRRTVDWEPTFFIDLIRGLDAPPANDWVLLFMLSECSLNFLYFQLLTLSKQPPFYNASAINSVFLHPDY